MRLSDRLDQDAQEEAKKAASGSFGMKGALGEIRVGYQLVARITAWTLTGVGAADAVLTGTLIDANPAWIAVPPTRVRLRVGKGWWRWNVVTKVSDTQYRLHGEPTKE